MNDFLDLSTIYLNPSVFNNHIIYFSNLNGDIPKKILDFYGVTQKEILDRTVPICILKNNDKVILMTDTNFERLTNKYFLENASGDVLIFGLGMGMIIYPLLNSTNINTITIVENNQDIIDFVYPKIQERDTNSKVTVVNGDSNTWHLTDNSKYDFIYFDTAKTPKESIDSESTLKPLYLKNKRDDNSIIHFWCSEIKDLNYFPPLSIYG
jgi:hypothetical protein